MFSRIYKSARALLIETPQNPSSQTPLKRKGASPAMVTSRSQSRAAGGEDAFSNDNTMHVHGSSTGKKRRLGSGRDKVDAEREAEVATPSAVKKRKILPLREKTSSPAVRNSVPVVEIPAMKVTREPESMMGTPAKPIEIEDDVEESSEADDVSEEEEEKIEEPQKIEVDKQTNHKRLNNEEAEPEFYSTAQEVPETDGEAADSEADDVSEEEEEEIEEPQKVEVDKQTKHKRFDNEEAKPELYSTAQEVPETAGEVADSEQDSDSEDDAPEAIGIQEAAREVKSKERDTAKAVKEQLSATRKKRKERDEILKRQSQKGKKRRPISTAPEPEQTSSDGEGESTSASQIGAPVTTNIPTHALTSRSVLPDFLPAEYLEETDPQELIRTEDDAIPRKKAKKTMFIDAALKAPKDRRVGKTTYRVAKAASTHLAPKASFVARSTKEAWLQGRSGGKVDPNRRAFGKAFGR